MKITKFAAIPLSYVCLVLLAAEAQAKASQLEDISQWTQDQVQAYLDKYDIVYDKNDESLLDTAKRYRDAAYANANIFISQSSDSVTRLIEGLKIKLEKHYHLTSAVIDAFTTDLSHELKQLELSGHLTQDRVKQALDQYQTKAIKQKYVTEAQWKDIMNDIQGSFVNPTWYQRLFGPSQSNLFDKDSFHTWSSSLTNRVQQNKELTKQEIEDVVQTVQRAIQKTSDLSKLATAEWWQQLATNLEKDAVLKKDQAQDVIESLKDDIIAYKIFAMDYAGEKVENTQGWIASTAQYVMDRGQGLYQAVIRPLQRKQSDIQTSAEETKEQVKEYVDDTAHGFGKYWKNKELETYRKIGYTEAHINWLENYLSETFHDKAKITKESIQHAIQTIRKYLLQTKVQTEAMVDAQLKSLEALLEKWRHTVTRTDL